jgi:predicted RNA-binding protein with RPS1 domain
LKKTPLEQELNDAVGKTVTVHISEIQKEDSGRATIVASRKKLLSETYFAGIKEGDIVEGTVSSLTTFGMFVDVNGVEGMVHVSRMASFHVADPSTLFKKGDHVKATISSIDKDKFRIGLSTKDFVASPWDDIETTYPTGAVVKGKVKRFTEFGTYIELQPGIEGLLRNGDLAWGKRGVNAADLIKEGQVIDIALYEAVFNCMESLLPEYSAFGEVRQAAGSALPGIAPTNAYLCVDGGYVLVAGNGDSIFKRLMTLIGRDDLGNDPQLATNEGRVKRVTELDQAIGSWAKTMNTSKALEMLDSVAVPAGRIYTVADIANDPHYKARDNIQTILMQDGSQLDVPGVIPKLSRTPGSIKTLAPDIGEHTDAILNSIGLSDDQIKSLKERGVAFTKSARED